MASKNTIEVQVTGDARSAIKALGQVTTQMGTMQQKAVAVGSAIGGVLAKGVTAAIDAVRDLGGEILAQSDSVQKFEQTMSFAGLDTTAIEQAKQATKDYANQTVYDLTTVQNTTAQLAANGVKDYTGLTKAAGNLNAVAGGNAETFRSVAMVLTQTAGAGKLTTENWTQLADAIPGASGRLQEAMLQNGAYVGNFREAMEEGEISADEFNQALMQLGMSDVAQEAATSTATFEGAWGNMMASVTGGLSDLVNIVKPAITQSIGWAATQISTWLTQATTAVQDFIDGVTQTDAWSSIQTAWQAIVTAAGSLGTAIQTVAQTVVPALGQIQGAAGIGQIVGSAFSMAASFVTAVANALTALGEWVTANAETVGFAITAIAGGFAAFQGYTIITTVTSALSSFGGVVGLAQKAMAGLNAVMSANPIGVVITLVGALTSALAWFFTQTETGRQIWSDFTSFLGTCVEKIVGFFQSLPGKIGGFFQDAANTAQNIWTNVQNFFQGIWEGISNGARSVIDGIGGAFQSAVDKVRGILDGLVSTVRNIWNTISGIVSSITSAVSNAWDTVTGWLPFSAAPASLMAAPAMATAAVMPRAMPLVAVGGADSQGASHGAINPGRTISDLIGALTSKPAETRPATIINLTVQLSDLNPDPDKTARKIVQLIDHYESRRR